VEKMKYDMHGAVYKTIDNEAFTREQIAAEDLTVTVGRTAVDGHIL